ncbi:hypothetical protein F4821DRAFT_83948 [Hypoxylon rubiginosum]|uniref:Uncharacterized protein n=1 Tax=Hypoxylon rubiginosum TaxID=110542 RepID=A0ACC0D8H7_9PEZI|nr:hypothetical protein F4821DRAFT_83948 [Hypoxylon rubiginosum]
MSYQGESSTDESQESVDPGSLAATDLQALSPTTILQKYLTVNSVLTITSSFARQSQSLRYLADTQKYRDIGEGPQGIVYERLGSILATKKELPTNKGRRLSEEFAIHRKVFAAFTKYKVYSDIHVPQPYDFTPGELISPQLLSQMPENDRQPSDIVTMERILPLPKVVRKAIIQKFHPDGIVRDEHRVTQILDERENKHCLARVYLGMETLPIPKESFSLRNFPLTLDRMVDLGLDAKHFAVMIGNAYAIMHWAAIITGDDVEFVLGTSASPNNDFQHRRVHMYLLDFGRCDTVNTVNINEYQEDVFQALKRSMVRHRNQIYLPHPRRNTELYQAWKSAYMSTSDKIVRQEGLSFDPEEFLSEYEEYLDELGP